MTLFQFPVRIYWEDTDAGGIVFYANYLKYFERARTEWLRSLQVQQWQLREQTGGVFVVQQVQLSYHRPARLDDELIVTARLKEAGRASMLLEQQALLNTEPNTTPSLLCEATVRIGWVNAATLKPARLPADLVQRLTP